MPHSHVQAVEEGFELLQAQGFALAVAPQEVLKEGGGRKRRGGRGIAASERPRGWEEAEQSQQAAAPQG